MGVVVDMQNDGAAKGSWVFSNFVRRKHVDSVLIRRKPGQQLAKKLSAIDLIAIGNLTKKFQNSIVNLELFFLLAMSNYP